MGNWTVKGSVTKKSNKTKLNWALRYTLTVLHCYMIHRAAEKT